MSQSCGPAPGRRHAGKLRRKKSRKWKQPWLSLTHGPSLTTRLTFMKWQRVREPHASGSRRHTLQWNVTKSVCFQGAWIELVMFLTLSCGFTHQNSTVLCQRPNSWDFIGVKHLKLSLSLHPVSQFEDVSFALSRDRLLELLQTKLSMLPWGLSPCVSLVIRLIGYLFWNTHG